MVAITDKLSGALGVGARTAGNLFNKLSAGSSETTPDSEQERKVQASLDAVSSIGNTVSSTATALQLLKAETNIELTEVNSTLLELDVLAKRILDPSDEVNEEDAKRFKGLSDTIDTLIDENKDIKVTSDATLNDFLIAFEKKKGEVTLASRSVSAQAEQASNEIGGNFSEFLTDNIKSISTSDLGKAASDVAISAIAGPFAPIVQSLTGLVDTDALVDGAKNLFGKGEKLVSGLKGKNQAEALITNTETTEATESIEPAIEDLAKINKDGFAALAKENDEDDEPTAIFREEQVEREEEILDLLDDKLSDIEDAVGDVEAGGSGGISGLLGSTGIGKKITGLAKGAAAAAAGAVSSAAGSAAALAVPALAVAAAGAAGFAVGTGIRELGDFVGEALTGEEDVFTAGIGEAIGPGIDTALAFFGNEAAKDRLTVLEAIRPEKERQEKTTEALSSLGDETSSTGFLGFGGFDFEDFREVADELKNIRVDTEAPERVSLIDQQIQSLQTSLDDEGTTSEAQLAIGDLIAELRTEIAQTSVVADQEVKAIEQPVSLEQTTPIPMATPIVVTVNTPKIESPEQTAPLVPVAPFVVKPQPTAPTVVQPAPKKNLQSMPMMNDDLGMNLVNTGVI